MFPAMTPPPPVRLSTTNCQPSRSVIFAESKRAAVSTTPPGATPITIKRVPMSQEGNAIVSRINASPDTRIPQIQAELRGIRAQYLQFVSGGPVDLDKLDVSLRRELALTAEARSRDNDRLLMILRALSESDRIAYLQRSIQVTRSPNAPSPGTTAPGKPAATTPAAAPAPVRGN